MIAIGVPAESAEEPRIGLSPETAKKLVKLGAKVSVRSGAGLRSHFSDEEYKAAGADIVATDADAVKDADIVLTVRRPSLALVKSMKQGAMLIAMLDPYSDAEGLQALAKSGASLFAMELMPRISRAQSMDVLSSQANLAGYKAVVDAAAAFERALPMMMTAAGTVPAARVFVMGVGVAGLQAIATARRLGAIVTATDVRPAVKEQVASLGAKFIAVEDEEFKQAETAAGYAKEMSDEYKKKQAALVADHVKNQDIVITTALIPGRPAPKLISKAMIESMRPGSIIVDLAVERGGNAELAKAGEVVEHNGVRIMGKLNLPGAVPVNASSLYARNLLAFIEPMVDKKTGALAVNWDDELVKGTLIAKDGAIVNAMIAERAGAAAKPAAAPAKAKSEADGNGAPNRRSPKGARHDSERSRHPSCRCRRVCCGHGVTRRRSACQGRRGRRPQLHLVLLDLRDGDLRRLLRGVERDAGAAHAADERDQRHLLGDRGRRVARRQRRSGGWSLRARLDSEAARFRRAHHGERQHLRRVPRHPAHARHVSEEKEVRPA